MYVYGCLLACAYVQIVTIVVATIVAGVFVAALLRLLPGRCAIFQLLRVFFLFCFVKIKSVLASKAAWLLLLLLLVL